MNNSLESNANKKIINDFRRLNVLEYTTNPDKKELDKTPNQMNLMCSTMENLDLERE
jgi:hypothetical protein